MDDAPAADTATRRFWAFEFGRRRPTANNNAVERWDALYVKCKAAILSNAPNSQAMLTDLEQDLLIFGQGDAKRKQAYVDLTRSFAIRQAKASNNVNNSSNMSMKSSKN